MENKINLQNQFRRYVAGDMDEIEVRNFILHIRNLENQEEVKESILSLLEELDSQSELSNIPNLDFILADSLSAIKTKINIDTNPQVKNISWKKYLGIAATIAVIVAISFWYFTKSYNQLSNIAQVDAVSSIQPGKNSATLTLANGKKIILNDAVNGELATENGIQILKEADGQIVYKILDNTNSKELKYNQLSTARGESYQMQLPDGTKVWLNAESSITYPSNINSQSSRKVKLEGEGYFEVSKVKNKTFEVETDKAKIQVLGTQFNISNYSDDKISHVTLVEGKVNVIDLNNANRILEPNQQLTIDGLHVFVDQVDVAEVIAWKNGEFMFDKQTLEEIMKSISRWYDIDVEISQNLKKMRIWGSISRSDDLSKVLQIIQLTDKKIQVKIDGRRVKLMK